MEKGQVREKELEKEAYYSDGYFSDNQLYSFVEQIKGIKSILNKLDKNIKILEIGKGNGFVSNFLKSMGYEVTTFDINSNLAPDIIGDILELSSYFKGKFFDLVICSEVLEHMELKYFEKSLNEINIISNNYIYITLPEYKSFSGFTIFVKLFNKTKKISCIFTSKAKHKLPKEHFWELNSEINTNKSKIKELLNQHFDLIKDGRFELNPYHNYFVLRKK